MAQTAYEALRGKVVIVTGAGTGIGRALIKMIANAGSRCVLLGRRWSYLEEAREEAVALGAEALAIQADVGSTDQVGKAISLTLERFGHIDGIVNNAGVARFAPFEHASLEDLDLMLNAHLRGPINLIRAALPSLRSGKGNIVNVSSVGGVLATPGRAFYGATKAALNHLTRSLARELAPDVRVNAVVPGPVRTPMYDDLGITNEERLTLEKTLINMTPAGRFAEPDEVARWIVYLLDEQNSWVTGALICVDGGRTS